MSNKNTNLSTFIILEYYPRIFRLRNGDSRYDKYNRDKRQNEETVHLAAWGRRLADTRNVRQYHSYASRSYETVILSFSRRTRKSTYAVRT